MWNLKYDTNEPTYEIETEQTDGLPRDRDWRRDGVGGGGWQMQAFTCRMDKQQDPAV